MEIVSRRPTPAQPAPPEPLPLGLLDSAARALGFGGPSRADELRDIAARVRAKFEGRTSGRVPHASETPTDTLLYDNAYERGRREQQVWTLVDALLRYGQHTSHCRYSPDGSRCTCGLAAALEVGDR